MALAVADLGIKPHPERVEQWLIEEGHLLRDADPVRWMLPIREQLRCLRPRQDRPASRDDVLETWISHTFYHQPLPELEKWASPGEERPAFRFNDLFRRRPQPG